MVLNEENIVEYEKSIHSNFEDTIKQYIIDRINLKYSDLLETGKLTTDLIDEMTVDIKYDESLEDYLNTLIDDEIENNVFEKEDEETEEEI